MFSVNKIEPIVNNIHKNCLYLRKQTLPYIFYLNNTNDITASQRYTFTPS